VLVRKPWHATIKALVIGTNGKAVARPVTKLGAMCGVSLAELICGRRDAGGEVCCRLSRSRPVTKEDELFIAPSQARRNGARLGGGSQKGTQIVSGGR